MEINKIANIISPYNKLLIGFSGGLDSTVLLHRLKILRDKESNIKLRAIHINYGISPNSDKWTKHCSSLCQEWKIPLIVVYVSLVNKKSNIEAEARDKRYAVFKKKLLPDEVLVIAHNLDDQCQTFLLALKRGSGPTGLSSMPIIKKFASTHLLRPLLNETRESLMIWAKKNSLYWIEDESNYDDRYDRNFLRLHVIPLLHERWPYILNTIARSASLCAEQEKLIDELVSKDLTKFISSNGALKIKSLIELSSPHRSAIIRRWFSKNGILMPSSTMLKKLWKEIAQARKDSNPCMRIHGYEIRRFKDCIWKIKPSISCSNIIIKWYNIKEPLKLPYEMKTVSLKIGGHVRLPSSDEIVSVRFKVNGILHIYGRCGGRKIKKIWQELNIPPWERSNIPLLFYGDKLIAAAGKFITKDGWTESGMSFEFEIQ